MSPGVRFVEHYQAAARGLAEVRGLAAKIIGKWQGHVRKSRTEIVFAELGRLRGLAQQTLRSRLRAQRSVGSVLGTQEGRVSGAGSRETLTITP